jgi:predicted DNA-binding transcriptional regulator YafY
MSTSARTLQLLSLLQTHRHWPGSELAERLEVSERTLRRDVDRLRDLGYPVHAVRGVAGGYQLQAGAAMPPLLLDDEEAVAIVVGLRAAAGGMVEGIDDTSVRALSKVVQVMPPRLRRRVDALRSYTVPAVFGAGGPTLDAGLLSTLAQACRDDERLRFGYRTRDGDERERSVEPHRLVSVGRRWYLVGWDLTRHDWRSFRVDRIGEAATTGVRFRQRDLPGGDPAEFVKSGLRTAPQKHHVSVLVHADADDVRRKVGRWAEVSRVQPGDGSCRVTMETDDLGWPMLALAAIGAEFEVEGPDELVEQVARVADLFGRAGP